MMLAASSRARAAKDAASKRGCITAAEPAIRVAWSPLSPCWCESGSAWSITSSAAQRHASIAARMELRTFPWESGTPFGSPVVPEVNARIAGDPGPAGSAGGPDSASGSSREQAPGSRPTTSFGTLPTRASAAAASFDTNAASGGATEMIRSSSGAFSPASTGIAVAPLRSTPRYARTNRCDVSPASITLLPRPTPRSRSQPPMRAAPSSSWPCVTAAPPIVTAGRSGAASAANANACGSEPLANSEGTKSFHRAPRWRRQGRSAASVDGAALTRPRPAPGTDRAQPGSRRTPPGQGRR